MILGWIRILVLLFVALSVAYVVLWFKAQKRERARIKADYHKSNQKVSETEYAATELEKFNSGLKPKMLLFVYIIPFALAFALLFVANT